MDTIFKNSALLLRKTKAKIWNQIIPRLMSAKMRVVNSEACACEQCENTVADGDTSDEDGNDNDH